MKLTFTNGALDGKTLDYDAQVVSIGSGKNNIVVLAEEGISSRHAKIEKVDNQWFVKDLDSTNGIRLNGFVVKIKERIYHGDILKIGTIYCEVAFEDKTPRPDESSFLPKKDIIIAPIPIIQENNSADKASIVPDPPPTPASIFNEDNNLDKICIVPDATNYNLPKETIIEEKTEPILEDQKVTEKPLKITPAKETSIKLEALSTKKNVLTPQQKLEQVEMRRRALKSSKMSNRFRLGIILTLGSLLIFYLVPKFLNILENKYAIDLIHAENGKPEEKKITTVIHKYEWNTNKTNEPKEQEPKVITPKEMLLYIQSFPSGASVEINGENIGVTPLELPNFPAGTYSLLLHKPGYKVLEYEFKHPGNPLQAHTLEQDDYTLLLTSKPPGAAILVGGQLRGHTPTLMRDMAPGYNKITLTAPGFVTKSYEFDFTATNNRQYLNVELLDNRGTLSVITRPPNCKIFVNGDFMGNSTSSGPDDLISQPLIIPNLIPGQYKVEVSSPDGSEKMLAEMAIIGGEVTPKEFNIWMINSLMTLNDGTKIHGMVVNRNEQGDILFSEVKGQSKVYKKDEIASIEPSNVQKKYGFTAGIAVDKAGFKPLLSTIFNENDERNFDEISKNAADLGQISSKDLLADQKNLDLVNMVTKYRYKKLKLSGTVSYIRAGEVMYAIVLDDKIECFLVKDESMVDKLKSLVGKNVTLSGLCLGVGGIDRIVVVKTEIVE